MKRLFKVDISPLDIRYDLYPRKCVELYRTLKGIAEYSNVQILLGSELEGVFGEEQLPVLEEILHSVGLLREQVVLYGPLLNVSDNLEQFRYIPVGSFEDCGKYDVDQEEQKISEIGRDKRFTLFLRAPKPFRSQMLLEVVRDPGLEKNVIYTYRKGVLDDECRCLDSKLRNFFGDSGILEKDLPRKSLTDREILGIRKQGKIDICCETYYNYPGHWFFTEKTFAAVACKQPLIFLSEMGTVKAFQQLGYRTFSKFWDETYDLEVNPVLRFQKTLAVIKRISELSEESFLDLQYQIQEIVDYNLEVFRQNTSKNKERLRELELDGEIFYVEGGPETVINTVQEQKIYSIAEQCREEYLKQIYRTKDDEFIDLM